MPIALARAANSRPMLPMPMTSTVESATSRGRGWLVPELVLRPFMLCLILHRLGQPLGQSQKHGNGVFGDDRAMDSG